MRVAPAPATLVAPNRLMNVQIGSCFHGWVEGGRVGPMGKGEGGWVGEQGYNITNTN